MDFIKNALREFKHVVWPTPEETKKYFFIVLVVLIAFGLYLFAVGTVFREALFGLKSIVNPNSSVPAQTIEIPEWAIDWNTLQWVDDVSSPEPTNVIDNAGITNTNPVDQALENPWNGTISPEVAPVETESVTQ